MPKINVQLNVLDLGNKLIELGYECLLVSDFIETRVKLLKLSDHKNNFKSNCEVFATLQTEQKIENNFNLFSLIDKNGIIAFGVMI